VVSCLSTINGLFRLRSLRSVRVGHVCFDVISVCTVSVSLAVCLLASWFVLATNRRTVRTNAEVHIASSYKLRLCACVCSYTATQMRYGAPASGHVRFHGLRSTEWRRKVRTRRRRSETSLRLVCMCQNLLCLIGWCNDFALLCCCFTKPSNSRLPYCLTWAN